MDNTGVNGLINLPQSNLYICDSFLAYAAADLDMPTVRTFKIHPPAVNLTAVPISIVDDDILEEDNERFRVTLETNSLYDSLYDLGVHYAAFDIIDNDRKLYTVEVPCLACIHARCSLAN